MDNKNNRMADEPSSTRLTPLESKSQAKGKPKEEIRERQERQVEDPARPRLDTDRR